MHSKPSSIDPYQKQYTDLGFERGELFEYLQETYHPVEVLYPGCSVHLTPACYFPHMVFVDQSPAAAAFFAGQEAILDFVRRNRTYRRTPYIQFIAQDFTAPLPVPQNQFDLVLALFTGGVSQACKVYLKIGGLLLSNNHRGDAEGASRQKDLVLTAVLQLHQGRYRAVDAQPGEPLRVGGQAPQSHCFIRQTSRGLAFVDDESYYLFRRVRLK